MRLASGASLRYLDHGSNMLRAAQAEDIPQTLLGGAWGWDLQCGGYEYSPTLAALALIGRGARYRSERHHPLAQGANYVPDRLERGDVILLEVQTRAGLHRRLPFGYHAFQRSVIQALLDAGLVVVIPSGNGGWDFNQPTPGLDPHAVAYLRDGGGGALYVSGPASFANRGPGFKVTGPTSMLLAPTAGFNPVISSGTSTAAAAVAGLTCRMQSVARSNAGPLSSALMNDVIGSPNLVTGMPNGLQMVQLVANNDAAALAALV